MTRAERAQLAWQVLVGAAHDRRIITYTMLGEMIGMGPGTLAPILGLVMKYCHSRGLPPLTVLVVNKDTGLPGSGLSTLEDLARDRENVFAEHWYEMIPPSAEQLEGASRTEVPPRIHEPTGSELRIEAPNDRKASGSGELDSHLRVTDQLSGRLLNEVWAVRAEHALYHHEGTWYHKLERFPGALFDFNGYIVFPTRDAFLKSSQLRIRQDVRVPSGICTIPGYVRVR